MNTWKDLKDLIKSNYLTKKLFAVVYTWKALQMLIIDLQREYINNLIKKNLGDYHDR